ncbi:hypothetical protein PanWU01x14_259630, partial [Parasponia andersonii]
IRPSSFPADKIEHFSETENLQLRAYTRESCPSGRVPVFRINENSSAKAKSIFKEMSSFSDKIINSRSPAKTVYLKISLKGPKQRGVGAHISAYELKSVTPGKASSANVYIRAGPAQHFSGISAGWMRRERDNEHENVYERFSITKSPQVHSEVSHSQMRKRRILI